MEEVPEFHVVLLLVVEPIPVFIHGRAPALAGRLAAAENELARLQADRKVRPIGGVVVSNIPERIAANAAGLTAALNAGGQKARDGMRAALGDRISLTPDASGRFLWAD